MKVYVVLNGQRYEGGDVECIFSSLEKARSYVLDCINEDPGRGHDPFVEVYPDEWIRGCYIITINDYEVL